MTARVSTVDKDAKTEKPKVRIKLASESFDRLTQRIEQVQLKAATPENLTELYSASKALTNYIERIARDNRVQAIHLQYFHRDNGMIDLIGEEGQRLSWGLPNTKKEAARKVMVGSNYY
jgi:hypothetical protein